MKAGQWQVGFSYRHLYADQWFVGTKVDETQAPYGQPLYLNINSYDLSVDYGVTNRLSLELVLPFSTGTHSRIWGVPPREDADGLRHELSAGGLGDISLVGTYWLKDPHDTPSSNVAFGLGVKTPSGRHTIHDTLTLSDGTVLRKLADQSIQTSDGGWGVIFQAQGYWTMSRLLFGYANGSYLMSTRTQASVTGLGVPDVYQGRAGLASPIWPSHGLSISLGGRIDGIPKSDLIGGADPFFRRPGYIVYVEPGVGIALGKHTLTLSVPVRVYQDFQESYYGNHGGDLANYLVIADYTLRF